MRLDGAEGLAEDVGVSEILEAETTPPSDSRGPSEVEAGASPNSPAGQAPIRMSSPAQSPLSVAVGSPLSSGYPKLFSQGSPGICPKLPGEESPGSYVPDLSYLAGSDCPSATPSSAEVQEAVKQNMGHIEQKFGNMLDTFSSGLAQEVHREQKHLMLMQDQVDKQRETLTKQLNEVNKKLAEEEQQRVYVQQTMQDTNEQLLGILSVQSKELEILRNKVAEIERSKAQPAGSRSGRSTGEPGPLVEVAKAPRPASSGWLGQLTSGVWSMFTVCGSNAGQPLPPPLPAAAVKDMETATLTKTPLEDDQEASVSPAVPPTPEAQQ